MDVNGANEAGLKKILPVFAGLTVRPFVKVSVQVVVALVNITLNGVGAGAVPPAAHAVEVNGMFAGTTTTNVVVPSGFVIVD